MIADKLLLIFEKKTKKQNVDQLHTEDNCWLRSNQNVAERSLNFNSKHFFFFLEKSFKPRNAIFYSVLYYCKNNYK